MVAPNVENLARFHSVLAVFSQPLPIGIMILIRFDRRTCPYPVMVC